MQEPRLQLPERNHTVRQAGDRGAVEGEGVGAGDEEIEGLLQGVKRRISENASGGHGAAPFTKEPPSRHAGYPAFAPNRPRSPQPREYPECGVLAGYSEWPYALRQVKEVGYRLPRNGVLGRVADAKTPEEISSTTPCGEGGVAVRGSPTPKWGSPCPAGHEAAGTDSWAGLSGFDDPVATRRSGHELCLAPGFQAGQGIGHRPLGAAEGLADLGWPEILAGPGGQVLAHQGA